MGNSSTKSLGPTENEENDLDRREYNYFVPFEIMFNIFSVIEIGLFPTLALVCKSWKMIVDKTWIAKRTAGGIQPTSPSWRFQTICAENLQHSMLKKVRLLQSHKTRVTTMMTYQNLLVVVGSDQPVTDADNSLSEWEISGIVMGMKGDESNISIKVWDIDTLTSSKEVTGEPLKVFNVQYPIMPKIIIDNSQMFVCGIGKNIQIWDFPRSKLNSTLQGSGMINFHVTQTKIIGLDDKGTIYFYDRTKTGKSVAKIENKKYCWLDGYQDILICATKTTLEFLTYPQKPKSPLPTVTLSITTENTLAPSTLHQVQGLVFLEQAGKMEIYCVKSKTKICHLQGPGWESILQVNNCLRVVGDFAFITDTGKICIFDLKKACLVSVVQERGIYYSLNGIEIFGDYLVCAVVEHGIKVWNWKERKLIQTLPEELPDCRFSYTGELVQIGNVVCLSSVMDGNIRVWQLG